MRLLPASTRDPIKCPVCMIDADVLILRNGKEMCRPCRDYYDRAQQAKPAPAPGYDTIDIEELDDDESEDSGPWEADSESREAPRFAGVGGNPWRYSYQTPRYFWGDFAWPDPEAERRRTADAALAEERRQDAERRAAPLRKMDGEGMERARRAVEESMRRRRK